MIMENDINKQHKEEIESEQKGESLKTSLISSKQNNPM